MKRAEVLPSACSMSFSARGRDTKSASVETLAQKTRHLSEFILVRLFERITAAFTHDIGTHCRVRDMCGDVNRPHLTIKGVKVLGEGLPIPAKSFVQGSARDIFDTFHHFDKFVVEFWSDGCKAHPAVAHGNGRNSVMRRGRQPRIPRCLSVVVRMWIDESGGHYKTIGINFTLTRTYVITHRDYAIAFDRDVAASRQLPRSINDVTISNYEIRTHRSDTFIQPLIAQRRMAFRESVSS
jgi:hypothetical protein